MKMPLNLYNIITNRLKELEKKIIDLKTTTLHVIESIKTDDARISIIEQRLNRIEERLTWEELE